MTPEELSLAIAGVLKAAVEAGEITVDVPDSVTVERPKSRDHGDWATNIALQLGKKAGMSPRDFAGLLANRLREVSGVASVDIAGPGFINITLDTAAAAELAHSIVEQGASYGQNQALQGHEINIEYVSANPTGPLHIGHTRWAALGDALVRLLRASGANVTAEYYINDAGAQMDRFGASVLAAINGQQPPSDGYRGEYINELAGKVAAENPELAGNETPEAVAAARETAYRLQLAEIQQTLDEFGVHFDVWFSERELHQSGAVAKAVERLREQGHIDDRDGAVWLRTTDFNDDKDRVLLRANGEPTYFAADAAYYLSKKDRGFSEKIYLLGADHHGYVGRLKAMAATTGDDPEKNIEILIGQLVSIGGAKLSKRAGNIIELRDLVNWLGKDAVRYSLARYPADSPLTLDGEILQKKTNDNPVFYVQYAHARTASVARNAVSAGVDTATFNASLLSHETESELLAHLGQFPGVVSQAAQFREPHRVARYLEELASAYHKWYDNCRVIPLGDNPVTDTHRARLQLNQATGVVLANGLALLGVSAPDRM